MNTQQYYKHYLNLHQNKWCRRLHVLGQITTLCFLFVIVKLKIWSLLILAPFVIYPFAWSGHFFFEKNRPAAFSNPLLAKACDWIMFKDWLLGRIER
jgi:hypothetical protein